MFLDHNNILNDNQFGFRLISHSYHSTHHALITLTDIIIKALDCEDIDNDNDNEIDLFRHQ